MKEDVERMKGGHSWALCLHYKGMYHELVTAVLAVLILHFDNHWFCGDWSKAGEGT
jgi:hypothetical protein